MKLNEVAQSTTALAPWMFKTKKEILDWINLVESKRKQGHTIWASEVTINPDLTIDVEGNVDIQLQPALLVNTKGGTALPVQFNRVSGNLLIYHNNLTTLRGSPPWVGNMFGMGDNNIKTLEYAPKHVGAQFISEGNPLSMKNVHKYVDYIGKSISIPKSLSEPNILGLMKIEGLVQAKMWPPPHLGATPLSQALDIINKHLKGDRSVLKAQRDLLKAGLKEFAKL